MSLPVLGQPFEKMFCPTHKQEVGLNKNGHCPYCFITSRGGKPTLPAAVKATWRPKVKRDPCSECGDTRPLGKNGCPGCYTKKRQSECATDYTKRGIATAMEVHTSYGEALGLHQDTRPANERWPAFEIGYENPQPEPSPQLEMDFEAPTLGPEETLDILHNADEFIGPIYDADGVRRA